jgi:hypothetical protein
VCGAALQNRDLESPTVQPSGKICRHSQHHVAAYSTRYLTARERVPILFPPARVLIATNAAKTVSPSGAKISRRVAAWVPTWKAGLYHIRTVVSSPSCSATRHEDVGKQLYSPLGFSWLSGVNTGTPTGTTKPSFQNALRRVHSPPLHPTVDGVKLCPVPRLRARDTESFSGAVLFVTSPSSKDSSRGPST